jgi:hypothetical protein
MNHERAIATQSPGPPRSGAGSCILLSLLIVSALLLPPLLLFAVFGLFLILVVVRGAPSPDVVHLSGAVSSRLSPRSPPLPA